MEYKSTFVESFMGRWLDNHKTIIRCVNCKQRLRVPIDKGNLRVTCPKCKYAFRYSPHLLVKKCLGFPLLLTGGGLSGLLIAYLNHFYDITGFYLFFIIPVGAIGLGLSANIGFVATLAFLRTRGINYSILFLIMMSGMISLFAFWMSKYIVYSTGTITVKYVSRKPPCKLEKAKTELTQMEKTLKVYQSLIESSSQELQQIKSQISKIEHNSKLGFYVNRERYEKLVSQYNNLASKHNATVEKMQKLYNSYETKLVEINTLIDKFNRGEIGEEVTEIKKELISRNYSFMDYIKKTYEKRSFRLFGLVRKVPLATPSVDVEMGSFGLILLLLKQIGLFFALPAVWLWANRR